MIGFCGGDTRQIHLISLFANKGYPVFVYGIPKNLLSNSIHLCLSLSDFFSQASLIVGPVPFTKEPGILYTPFSEISVQLKDFSSYLSSAHTLLGGNFPKELSEHCRSRQISHLDLLQQPSLIYRNAIATAEGILAHVILSSPINLQGSHCAVLGFGTCGEVLAHKLAALQAQVTVVARKKGTRGKAYAYGHHTTDFESLSDHIATFDFIFNTVPDLVINDNLIKQTKESVILADLASAPGGIDYSAASMYHRSATLYPALPGKVAPLSSALFLADEITEYLHSHPTLS